MSNIISHFFLLISMLFNFNELVALDLQGSYGNRKGVAIDIGAGNGSSTDELASYFRNVIAVEPDLDHRFNLDKYRNKVIHCDKYISQSTRAISDSITFKQLIFDYILSNPRFKNRDISFINCDIGGNEESILEDILHYAYNNKVNVRISFRTDLWTNKQIDDFSYLFEFFNTSCQNVDVSDYLKSNPSACITFKAKTDAGQLFKKNITSVIIGFNQLTYIRDMVNQLKKYTNDIIVVDNNSTFPPLLKYYEENCEFTVLRLKKNYGHFVYKEDFVNNLAGDVFVITDPDLEFNPRLPQDFMNVLISTSNHFKASRVGFALLIDSDEIRSDVFFKNIGIKDWERQFWSKQITCPLYPNLEIYEAEIDTTFCLINRRYAEQKSFYRVAGDYTCVHLPWMKNFRDRFIPGEYETYSGASTCSCWFKENTNR
jgi:hypothetical protein